MHQSFFWSTIAARLALFGLLVLFAGCPGTLQNPERFLMFRTDGPRAENAPVEIPGQPDAASQDSQPTQESQPTPEPGPEPPPDDSPLPAGCNPNNIFRQRCVSVGCHAGANPAGQLDLSKPSSNIRDQLRNQKSKICTERNLVEASDPLGGLFWEKLSGTTTCGAPMPLGKKTLTSEELDCIKAWLTLVIAP